MVYFVKAIGIVFLALGAINLVRPATARAVIGFAKVGNRIYFAGAVRIIIGGLLLLSTPKVQIPWIPAVIGSIALIAGILIYVLGTQKVHTFLDWVHGKPDNVLRAFAATACLFGILLIYAA